MPLTSQVSNDIFLHVPATVSNDKANRKPPRLIFFVTGNPGLLGYYHEFLLLLSEPSSANRSTSIQDCYIAGYSLAGFELEPPTTDSDQHPQARHQDVQPYGLTTQTNVTYERLDSLANAILHDNQHTNTSHGCVEVILIGHSVGAYIALEIISRWHRNHPLHESTTPKTGSGTKANTDEPPFSIKAAILLTPTVVDLPWSPSGRYATPLLTYLPFLPSLAQGFVHALGTILPEKVFESLVSSVAGMERGSTALSTTLAFVRSEGGVKQGLYLAGDEMKLIMGDKWGEEVWGAVEVIEDEEAVAREEDGGDEGERTSRLVFWFAKEDHWVADRTREEIIRVRGTGKKSIRMVVDETEGLVHAWCITQSKMVAEKVRGWIEEILNS